MLWFSCWALITPPAGVIGAAIVAVTVLMSLAQDLRGVGEAPLLHATTVRVKRAG